jgi:signal peptidase I
MTDQFDNPAPAKKSRPGLARRRRLWREIIEIIVLVVTIYTCVNLATARAIVLGSSMQPNFHTGQLVIVNRFAYYFSNPQRGDVIVLHNPAERCKDVIKNRSIISLPFIIPDDAKDDCEDLIKRVIGLPGETVEIKFGRVYINGTRLEEPYVNNYCEHCGNKTWVLEQDQYFVLGDNRNNSLDSSSFGPINRSLVVGQAWIRYWPIQEMNVISHPSYGPISTTYVTPTPEHTPGELWESKS